MKQLVTIQVNGDLVEVAIEPGDTLLHVLREDVGLVGPKRGCDGGGCGSCTVQLDGRAVYSCMTYARSVQGRAVTTVEAMSRNGELDPLQQAFVQAGAVQCGYCTSGMLLTARELLEDPLLDEERIRHGIAGNLCRCTGYQKIVDAIQLAAASR